MQHPLVSLHLSFITLCFASLHISQSWFTVLYCNILYRTVLYSMYCTVQYSAVLYCAKLYCTLLCYCSSPAVADCDSKPRAEVCGLLLPPTVLHLSSGPPFCQQPVFQGKPVPIVTPFLTPQRHSDTVKPSVARCRMHSHFSGSCPTIPWAADASTPSKRIGFFITCHIWLLLAGAGPGDCVPRCDVPGRPLAFARTPTLPIHFPPHYMLVPITGAGPGDRVRRR